MRSHIAIAGVILLTGCQSGLRPDRDRQRTALVAQWSAPGRSDLACVYYGEPLDTGGLVHGVQIRRTSDDVVLAEFAASDPGSIPFVHHHPQIPWSPDGAWLALQDGATEGFVVAPATRDPRSIATRVGTFKIQLLAKAARNTAPFHEFVRWVSEDRFEFQLSMSYNRWIAVCDLRTHRIQVQSDGTIASRFEPGLGCDFVVQAVGEGAIRENFQSSRRPRIRPHPPSDLNPSAPSDVR